MLVPTSISISFSDAKDLAAGAPKESGVFVFSSNCMEYRRSAGELSSRQRLHSQQSTPILNQTPSPIRRVPVPYSSPLPQTQWAEVPLPYRPRNYPDYPDSDDEVYESVHNSAAPAWYLRPPETPYEVQTAQAGSEARRRRRDRGLRNVFTRNQNEAREQPVDVGRLYPEMNPYANRTSTYSTYSAPEIMEHYHVPPMIRADPPSYPTSPNRHLDLPPTSIPRSPTYPPATRRRGNSAAGGDENAFTDEEEFHLFVQATAGLGPDVAFRHSHPLSPTERWRAENDIPVFNRSVTTGDIAEVVSPLGETPTAVFGLAQLPQMPERHQHSLPRRERAGSVTPGLDQWLHNPAAALTEFEEISPVDERDDDELPDYAQSQAEAQAHQRAEATRRAQELQRRWQMSGSRRGI